MTEIEYLRVLKWELIGDNKLLVYLSLTNERFIDKNEPEQKLTHFCL